MPRKIKRPFDLCDGCKHLCKPMKKALAPNQPWCSLLDMAVEDAVPKCLRSHLKERKPKYWR